MGEIQELVGRLHEGLGEDAARLFFGMEKPWPGSAREGASGCSAAPSPEIASGFVGDVREVDIVVSARDIARVWGAMRNASKQVAAHRSFQTRLRKGKGASFVFCVVTGSGRYLPPT